MQFRIWHLARPLNDRCRYEAEEVCLDIHIPVLLGPGSLIKLPGARDPICVDRVYWDAEEPEIVHLFSRDPTRLPEMRDMLAEGWHSAQSVIARKGATPVQEQQT